MLRLVLAYRRDVLVLCVSVASVSLCSPKHRTQLSHLLGIRFTVEAQGNRAQWDNLASFLGIQNDTSDTRRKRVALEAFKPCLDFGLENRYHSGARSVRVRRVKVPPDYSPRFVVESARTLSENAR